MELLYYLNIVISVFFAIGGLVTNRIIANRKPNLWFGVRNKYTLKNEIVWKKTNQFAGLLLMILSLVIVMPNFIVEPTNSKFYIWYPNVATLVGLGILVIIIQNYSKKLFQKYDDK